MSSDIYYSGSTINSGMSGSGSASVTILEMTTPSPFFPRALPTTTTRSDSYYTMQNSITILCIVLILIVILINCINCCTCSKPVHDTERRLSDD